MRQIPVGVDIGESQIKFAMYSRRTVRRLVAEPVPDQMVRESQILSPEAMSAFLREMAGKHHFSGRRCAVALPASLAFTRRVRLPAMTSDQLRMNLPYEFRDYITQEMDHYLYDYALLKMEYDETGTPKQMDLMAVAALKSTIQTYIEIFRQAGLKLVLAAPEEFAYASLIRRYIERHSEKGGHCIIDLGHTAARIHLYTEGRFEMTRVVEYGGAAVDVAIAGRSGIDVHLAHDRHIANQDGCLALEECRDVYRSIAMELVRAAQFYGYHNPDCTLNGIWLCGGGSQNPFLVEQIRQDVSLELRPMEALLPGIEGGGALALFPAAVGILWQ